MPGTTNDDRGEERLAARQLRSWLSSAACAHNGCVQAATTPDGVALRDSRSPDRQVEFSRQDWADFVAGVKAGDFDAV
jgi:hypothetical protein